MISLIARAEQFGGSTAIISNGMANTYSELLERSAIIAGNLLGEHSDLNGVRVAFMVDPGFEYVAVQWGIWRAGGIAVPLCLSYPFPSLQYVIEDSGSDIIIADSDYHFQFETYSQQTNTILLNLQELSTIRKTLPIVEGSRDALILYTSGTTGSPKGVVTEHSTISAQIESLVEAWEWTKDDHVLNVLPLHHVHGIINILCCALWRGAICQFLPKFDPKEVYSAFLAGRINVFMAVPTIYYKLISYWESFDVRQKDEIHTCLSSFRLMVSGSAALPITTMERWEKISGQVLLERYGMTEIGMAISNPYNGHRKPGHVGIPLPGVSIRLINDEGKISIEGPGEIQVKGTSVFKKYWNRPEATSESFSSDGWFKTGDIAEFKDHSYRILGRSSVDIIKSGGYKISALEIEEVSRQFSAIKDCGVVGLPDEEWGEIIGIGIVPDGQFDWDTYMVWLKERLPGYKTPRVFIELNDLPRNAMGKVTKNELKNLISK